ncbi:MAG: hypothetical protein AB9834_13950 [Lentimicrobium sp.]
MSSRIYVTTIVLVLLWAIGMFAIGMQTVGLILMVVAVIGFLLVFIPVKIKFIY